MNILFPIILILMNLAEAGFIYFAITEEDFFWVLAVYPGGVVIAFDLIIVLNWVGVFPIY